MIRCIVFDFDGTLVDSNRIKHQGFFEIAKEFADGERLMQSILAREDAGDRYSIFERFAELLAIRADAAMLAERYTEFCQQKIAKAPEIPGAADALDHLKEAGMLLYVNSATPIGPLLKLIRLRQMEPWFNGVYGAPEGKAENLKTILAENGVSGHEVLMVGDSEIDRMAAESAGCHFVGVRNCESGFLKSPSFLMDDLRNLTSTIMQI